MTEQEENYERLIFDNARNIASSTDILFTLNYYIMVMSDLKDHEKIHHLCEAVKTAIDSPDYELKNYRGKMCDEGVVEAVKEILRVIHHDEITPEIKECQMMKIKFNFVWVKDEYRDNLVECWLGDMNVGSISSQPADFLASMHLEPTKPWYSSTTDEMITDWFETEEEAKKHLEDTIQTYLQTGISIEEY